MADPAFKIDHEPAVEEAGAEAVCMQPVDGISNVMPDTASPARDLQERLKAGLSPTETKMSARAVTAMVLTVCLATWLTGYLFYSAL